MSTKRKLLRIIGLLLVVLMLMIVMPEEKVMAQSTITVCSSGCDYTTIQDAIDDASDGDTIEVAAGIYNPASTILIDKPISILGPDAGVAKVIGVGGDTVKTFEITSGDVVIKNLEITLGSPPNNQDGIISIPDLAIDNIEISNNEIYVDLQAGEMSTWFTRAINVGRYVTNLVISGNTMYNTRSGLVVHYNSEVTITDNVIYNTKGGIMNYTGSLADYYDRVITNNSWADIHNEWDIVWNSGGGPYEQDYDESVLGVSQANNNGYVLSLMTTDSYPDCKETLTGNRSHVFVDVSGTTEKYWSNGNMNLPYASIQDGIDAVVPGGSVFVSAGTYEENLHITKDLTLLGAGAGSTVIQSPDTLPVCLTTSQENKAIVCIESSDVTLDGFTIDGLGKGNDNHRFVGVAFHNAGGTLQNSEVLNIKDTPFSGTQHGIAIYSYNEDETANTINVLDNTITDFQKNAMALNANDTTPLNVLISGNTVIGAGPTSVTAQNGIQVWAMLGTGVISDNTVSGIYYTDSDGCDWVGTSILNYYADVDITGNTITGAQEAIYPYLGTGDITGNTISMTRQDECYCDAIYIYHPTASNIEVSDNVITYDANELTGYDSYGIALNVGDEDINFTAQGNQIDGFDYGIDLYNESSAAGDITSISLQNNILATALIDIWVEGDLQAAPLITGNKLLGDTVGLQNDLSFQVEASPNWWGSIAGPTSGQVVGDVDYTPWCGDEACSLILPDENGVIELSGNIDIPGGIVVDVPGLTFLLKDGIVIQNNSPCFIINADNITITTESLGGATCVPTSGSNGIEVADGVKGVTIEGLEITGDGSSGQNGIAFLGAITNDHQPSDRR